MGVYYHKMRLTSFVFTSTSDSRIFLAMIICCFIKFSLHVFLPITVDAVHYCGVIMGTNVSQMTRLTVVYSTVYSGADRRKHKSSVSLAFVRGMLRWPVNSPHKGPVTWKMFPFDDVILITSFVRRYHSMKTLTRLLAIYEGNPSVTDGWIPTTKRLICGAFMLL